MAREPMMRGEEAPTTNPLSLMPAEARQALMRPSEEIRAVLMARLANMSPDELRMLDHAISPDVARVLVRLLPELQQIVEQVAGNPREAAQPREGMGALGGM